MQGRGKIIEVIIPISNSNIMILRDFGMCHSLEIIFIYQVTIVSPYQFIMSIYQIVTRFTVVILIGNNLIRIPDTDMTTLHP